MKRFSLERLGLSFCVLVGLVISLVSFLIINEEKSLGELESSVLRLHIIANSDSKEDQELKLKIRDKILEETGDAFREARSKDEAEKIAINSLEKIRAIAQREISSRGFSYGARAEKSRDFFPTRSYGEYVFPAGRYDCVRVYLGEGKGKNWWCVMFPQLCVPSAIKGDFEDFPLEESSLHLKPALFATEVFEKVKNVVDNRKLK